MKRYLILAAIILALALTGWGLWERGNAARAVVAQMQTQRDTALAESQQRQLVINALWHNAERLERQRHQLADRQTELSRLASRRLEQLREVHHEDEDTARWADQPLPDRIIRLRDRATVTGADAYRQSLRDTEPVPATGESANDQR